MNALAQETDDTVGSVLPLSLRKPKGYDLKLILVAVIVILYENCQSVSKCLGNELLFTGY